MIPGQAKKTVVLGVLGVDAHVVGNKIMAHALESAGFKVVNIGTFSSQEDFIRAAMSRRRTPCSSPPSAATVR